MFPEKVVYSNELSETSACKIRSVVVTVLDNEEGDDNGEEKSEEGENEGADDGVLGNCIELNSSNL